jgi:hypothetical protein
VPAAFDVVIGRALAKVPAERYGSALAFASALLDAAELEPAAEPAPQKRPPPQIPGDQATIASS